MSYDTTKRTCKDSFFIRLVFTPSQKPTINNTVAMVEESVSKILGTLIKEDQHIDNVQFKELVMNTPFVKEAIATRDASPSFKEKLRSTIIRMHSGASSHKSKRALILPFVVNVKAFYKDPKNANVRLGTFVKILLDLLSQYAHQTYKQLMNIDSKTFRKHFSLFAPSSAQKLGRTNASLMDKVREDIYVTLINSGVLGSR